MESGCAASVADAGSKRVFNAADFGHVTDHREDWRPRGGRIRSRGLHGLYQKSSANGWPPFCTMGTGRPRGVRNSASSGTPMYW